jgi:hypothetical protein
VEEEFEKVFIWNTPLGSKCCDSSNNVILVCASHLEDVLICDTFFSSNEGSQSGRGPFGAECV